MSREQAIDAFDVAEKLYAAGVYDKAIDKFKEAHEALGDEPRCLNALAWAYVTTPDLELDNKLLATIYAKKCCDITQYKDPEYLETLAAVCAYVDQFDAAVKWQKKAIELAKQHDGYDTRMFGGMEFRLELYGQKVFFMQAPQTAVLAEYKKIVGPNLTSTSLDNITEDEKTKLIDYLRTVPIVKYMQIDDATLTEHYDVVLLLVTSQEVKDLERIRWARKLPKMRDEHIAKLRETLLKERELLGDYVFPTHPLRFFPPVRPSRTPTATSHPQATIATQQPTATPIQPPNNAPPAHPQTRFPTGKAEKQYSDAFDAYSRGDYVLGIKLFHEAHSTDPACGKYTNALARALTTCPNADCRDPDAAMPLIRDLCAQTDYKNPWYVDTYATAFAESGAFTEAYNMQLKAESLAANTPSILRPEFRSMSWRRQLYAKRIPYHMTPRAAIAAHFEKLARAPLSDESLSKLDTATKNRLINYLFTVPAVTNLTNDRLFVTKYFDQVLLILMCKDFSDEDRNEQFQKLREMTPTQSQDLRRDLLARLNAKGDERVSVVQSSR